MPPKGKKNAPKKDPKDILTSEEQEYLKTHMGSLPCVRCSDKHPGYECKTKYKGFVGWYGQLISPKKTAVDAWMKHYQEENRARLSQTSNATPLVQEYGRTVVDNKPFAPPDLEIHQPLPDFPPASNAKSTTASRPEPNPEVADLAVSLDGALDLTPVVEGKNSSAQVELVHLESTATSMATPQAAPTLKLGEGVQYNRPNNIGKQLLLLGKEDTDFPPRKEFRNRTTDVVTNHFEVEIPKNVTFHEYRISGIPKDAKRALSKMLIDTAIEHSHLTGLKDKFATDGAGTIISWQNLHESLPERLDGLGEWQLCHVVDGLLDVVLNLKYIGIVDTDGLQNYVNSDVASGVWDRNQWNANQVVNALNIVLGKHFDGGVVKHGANKFFVEVGKHRIEKGRDQYSNALCVLRGYFYTITPGMGKILVQINTSTSAFFEPILVSEFMQDPDFRGDLNVLRGVKVRIEYERASNKSPGSPGSKLDEPQNRIKPIANFSDRGVGQLTFTKETKDEIGNVVSSQVITVQDYTRTTYGVVTRHPHLQAVSLTKGKNTWFAPEHLRIMPYQIYKKLLPDRLVPGMMKIACRFPDDNRKLIEGEALAKLTLNNQSPIRVNRSMLRLPCYVIPYPQIQYGRKTAPVNQSQAKWNLSTLTFHQPGPGAISKQPFRYVMVIAGAVQNKGEIERAYPAQFESQFRGRGVGVPSAVSEPYVQQAVDYDSLKEMFQYYAEEMGDQVPQLIVLVLPKKDYQTYAIFKYLADKIFGFHSIVLTEAANMKGRQLNQSGLQQYMGNIAMKANLKRGGINHTVAAIANVIRNTLVIGADVTHPDSGSLFGCPSIAAVVGSVDATGGKFLGELRMQKRKQEMIDDMAELIAGRIQQWGRHNGNKFPAHILYYRDGVGETQYHDVQEHELSQISKACAIVAKRVNIDVSKIAIPKVTAVVVGKRHHTRFYPIEKKYTQERNLNCVPGTLVDQGVTSPFWDDFYLQSHNGLKGTAKSAHYFILQNEMGIPTPALEDFTHNLCHTYVRATLGVSYASPAYYADRLCERGRQYLRDFFSPSPQTRGKFDKRRKALEDQYPKPKVAIGDQKKTAAEATQERKAMKKKRDEVDEKMVAIVKEACEEKWRGLHEYNPSGRFKDMLAKRKEDVQGTMYWM